MSCDVLKFPELSSDKAILCGQVIKRPKYKTDYLKLVKRFLTEDDYRDVCTGILDPDYCAVLDRSIQNIISAYYSYHS